jgi:hypothetical protein
MKTVYHCTTDEFCCSQKETGGEYGVPLEIHCMSGNHCPDPGKQCLYRKSKVPK